MTVTKADLIAAREAVGIITKEAEIEFRMGNKEAAAYEAKWNGADSPEYWRESVRKAKEAQGDSFDLETFMKNKWDEFLTDTEAYKEDIKRGGGMLDRYTASAAGIGGVLGALVGGLAGGEKGAIIGGLVGALGLYAIQKLGIFDGTEVGDFFKTAVDKSLPEPVTPEDITKIEETKNTAFETAKKGLRAQGALGAKKDTARESAINTIKGIAAEQYGVDLSDEHVNELLGGLHMPGTQFTPEVVGGFIERKGLHLPPTAATPKTPGALPDQQRVTTPGQSEEEHNTYLRGLADAGKLPTAPKPTGDPITDEEARINYETDKQTVQELIQARADAQTRIKEERAQALKRKPVTSTGSTMATNIPPKSTKIKGPVLASRKKSKKKSWYDNILPEGETEYPGGGYNLLNWAGKWTDMWARDPKKQVKKYYGGKGGTKPPKPEPEITDPFTEGL
jgi:hypothetical protein